MGAMTEVPAIHNWPTNAHLIEDVARLHLDSGMLAFDATYGAGGFWKRWRPKVLLTNDIDENLRTHFHYDFRRFPWSHLNYDLVAYDPPYRLNGTPDREFDERYGLSTATRWQDRMELIRLGFREAARITAPGGVLIAKCQDQVVSGQMRWQTHMLHSEGSELGLRLVDRFDMVGGGLSQPKGRRQVHARGRGSTLLVFEKKRAARKSG